MDTGQGGWMRNMWEEMFKEESIEVGWGPGVCAYNFTRD